MLFDALCYVTASFVLDKRLYMAMQTIVISNFYRTNTRKAVIATRILGRPLPFVSAGTFLPRQELRMPLSGSRRIQRASLPKTTRKTIHRRYHVSHYALRSDRERCIEALKRLGASRGTNCFFDKAMILLTRRWGATRWSGRAELLHTVDFLIRIGARGSASGPEHLANVRYWHKADIRSDLREKERPPRGGPSNNCYQIVSRSQWASCPLLGKDWKSDIRDCGWIVRLLPEAPLTPALTFLG
jgi:hypothetical protein